MKFAMVFLVCLLSIISFAQSPGDLVITEWMANPAAVSDNNGEYVEFYNTTGSAIDINGLILRDDDFDSTTIDNGGPLLVPAGAFFVIGIDSNSSTNGGYSCNYQYSGFVLSNGADEIVLTTPAGVEICRINYTDGDPFGAGISAELSNVAFNVNGVTQETDYVAATSAFSAGDLGSPGSAGNTQTGGGNQRNPVLEFCTGTWCQWCPCGDSTIIKDILPNIPNAIILAYHGPTGNATDPFDGFPGSTIISSLGLSAYPTGVVDRVSGVVFWNTTWIPSMNSRVGVPAGVEIEMVNRSYDPIMRLYDVTVDITALENLSGQFNYSVILVEDEIVYGQTSNGTCTPGISYIPNYVYKWLVRDMMNGALGTEVFNGIWNQGQTITKNLQHTIPIPATPAPDIVPDNCRIVVLVYKVGSPLNSNAEIQQAEQWLFIPQDTTAEEFVIGEVSCPTEASQNCPLTASIDINMHNVFPPDTLLGSFTGTLEWNPNELDFVSHSGILQGFTGVVNTTHTDSGLIIFNGANPYGAPGIVNVLSIDFNAIGSVGAIAPLDLEFSSIGSAYTFRDLTPILIVNDDSLTITEEFLGDVDCDGQANSTDALIILSYDAGLPILDPCTIERLSEGFGDINSDGSSNSLDALIIISYDVGIPVPFPVGEIFCPN